MSEITDTMRLNWLELTGSIVNMADRGPHVCYGCIDSSEDAAHTFGKDYRDAIDQAMWRFANNPKEPT